MVFSAGATSLYLQTSQLRGRSRPAPRESCPSVEDGHNAEDARIHLLELPIATIHGIVIILGYISQFEGSASSQARAQAHTSLRHIWPGSRTSHRAASPSGAHRSSTFAPHRHLLKPCLSIARLYRLQLSVFSPGCIAPLHRCSGKLCAKLSCNSSFALPLEPIYPSAHHTFLDSAESNTQNRNVQLLQANVSLPRRYPGICRSTRVACL